ncbi:MAG: hypothetical protein PVF22_00930 [Candidatus Aminicenantes bacterium]
MNQRKTPGLFLLFLMVLAVFLGGVGPALAQQEPLGQQPQAEPKVEVTETIVPAPKNIKEKTAIYIFVGWMWLSILVLIFFLRLKIKEVDRLHSLGFFSEDKD